MRLRWGMILEQNKFFLSNTISGSSSESYVIDFAKMASSLNRKHIPNVDRKGNAQVYLIRVTPRAAVNTATRVLTAPNLYTTKDAVKEWHNARVKMITRGGMKMKDLGPYARHLRPFLNVQHENGTLAELDSEVDPAGWMVNNKFQGEEYTRTRLAVSTPGENIDQSEIRNADSVDTYSLTLCDASVAESTTADDPDESTGGSDQDSFVSVGMIDTWLKSFAKKPLATTDSLRIQADNPLLQLRIDSPSSEEVLEIVEDSSEEGRPWDLDGLQYTALTMAGYVRTNNNATGGSIIVEVPCGLMHFYQANADSSSDTIVTEFEILDIYDM